MGADPRSEYAESRERRSMSNGEVGSGTDLDNRAIGGQTQLATDVDPDAVQLLQSITRVLDVLRKERALRDEAEKRRDEAEVANARLTVQLESERMLRQSAQTELEQLKRENEDRRRRAIKEADRLLSRSRGEAVKPSP